MSKDDGPADPSTSSVEERFDGILDAVIHLESHLDELADMSPTCDNGKPDDDGNDVDNHGKIPGDEKVGCSPEEPCLNVLVYVMTAIRAMTFIPDKVNDESWSYEYTSEERRANERGKEHGRYSVSHAFRVMAEKNMQL